MITWICRKKASVAQSSTEAEYIAATMGAREAVWLQKLLSNLIGEPIKPTTIHYDNQSCIKLSMNSKFHDRSQLIKIPYHGIRDMVERRSIQLEYINRGEKTTNILTMALPK